MCFHFCSFPLDQGTSNQVDYCQYPFLLSFINIPNMRKTISKGLRKVLNLPRNPRDMTPEERRFYRASKRAYNQRPHNERADFLDSAARITNIVREQVAKSANARAARHSPDSISTNSSV